MSPGINNKTERKMIDFTVDELKIIEVHLLQSWWIHDLKLDRVECSQEDLDKILGKINDALLNMQHTPALAYG